MIFGKKAQYRYDTRQGILVIIHQNGCHILVRFLDHACNSSIVFGEYGLYKFAGTLVGFNGIGPCTFFEGTAKGHAHFLVRNENLRTLAIKSQISNMGQKRKTLILILWHRKGIIIRSRIDIDAAAADQAHHVVVDAIQICIDIIEQ